jgi:uncharacterized Zn finger protein
MGCFDNIYFDCPKCGEKIRGQSKSGECLLRNFRNTSVPADVAVGTSYVDCDSCGAKWKAVPEKMPRIKVHLEDPNKDESEDDEFWD